MPKKTLAIARYELIENVCNFINNSSLPSFIVAECLERILNEVRNKAEIEFNRDMQDYQAQLKEAEINGDNQ